MAAQNNSQPQKKGTGCLIPLIVVVVIFVLAALALADIDTGPVVAFLVVVGILIVVISSLVSKAKKKRAAQEGAAFHSHDRLSASGRGAAGEPAAHVCEDEMTHWKRQLDGFLSSGLIDKNEYRVLMERYRRDLEQQRSDR